MDKDVPGNVKYFDLNDGGKLSGLGAYFFMPTFLDWMPIEAKIFWFLDIGDGNPNATHMLFVSQGEQRLVEINKPLRTLTHTERQEQENGSQERTSRWIDEQGLSRSPRNQ